MSKPSVFFDQLDFIHLGSTNRKEVIDSLGSPKDYRFEDDFKVIYTYPRKGIEITIKMGHIATSSVVTSISVNKPFQGYSSNSLVLGMEFDIAQKICKELYLEEISQEDLVTYSLKKEKIRFQIKKLKGKLAQINISKELS